MTSRQDQILLQGVQNGRACTLTADVGNRSQVRPSPVSCSRPRPRLLAEALPAPLRLVLLLQASLLAAQVLFSSFLVEAS